MKFDNLNMKDFIPILAAALIASVIAIIIKPFAGLIALIVVVVAGVYTINVLRANSKELNDYGDFLIKESDSIAKKAVFNMPFPLVVTDEKGDIVWHNTHFSKIIGEDVSLKTPITDYVTIVSEEKSKDLLQGKAVDAVVKGNHYRVYPGSAKNSTENKSLLLYYFILEEDLVRLKKTLKDSTPIIIKIQVDNYQDAIDSAEESKRPMLSAEIDSAVRIYFSEYNAFIKKIDQDEFFVITDSASVEQIKAKKFDILDDLKELSEGNSIPITLSIGVSDKGCDFKQAHEEADTAIDVALARGGDQAVVKAGDGFEFFGGKSKAVEKRNKVKSRVIGTALRQLIDQSQDVYIMGHRNADMDAIGAGIGVLRAVLNRNRKGYIVLNSSNPSIDNIIERMKEEEPQMFAQVVTTEMAMENITKSSLIIMVDNHKPSFAEAPELLEGHGIVIIDHHRRGSEFVTDPVLTYVEPYASSTSELITEMLAYMGDELNLTHFEADALMSGIVVDTKNFTFQTGVRTFEAASILRRAGADMQRVKALFQDDYDTIRMRAEVVNVAEIYANEIAISHFDDNAKNSILVAAQAADELLDINGVTASFVIAKTGDKIHISGRSRGDVSVQLILEKLGGGGHFNMAGAQVMCSMEEAKAKLKKAIDEYMQERKSEK